MDESQSPKTVGTLGWIGNRDNTVLLSIIVGTGVAVAFFYSQIVIPIKDMQVKLYSIDAQLTMEIGRYDVLSAEMKKQGDDILILKQQTRLTNTWQAQN